MKKLVIGYVYNGKELGEDEKLFKKVAKKKNMEPVLISTTNWFDEKDLREQINLCDIIYNSSAEDFTIETEKTIEEFGKKIIDSSKAYYYSEDKWMFFLKCLKHNVPVPKTILLSENVNIAKKDLKEFGQWPVVLKRVIGTMGQFVEKAENVDEAGEIMKKFWEKGSEKLPIIAQELIHSSSYRVTIFGKKIVQSVVKESKGWKATGVYAKRVKRFKVDKELEEIVNNIMKFVDINVCGIDFLKKEDKWIALEVNSTPAFDFIKSERERMAEELVNLLVNIVKSDKTRHCKSYVPVLSR
jgi:ribosomal protein S6--L-glutamate ligase